MEKNAKKQFDGVWQPVTSSCRSKIVKIVENPIKRFLGEFRVCC